VGQVALFVKLGLVQAETVNDVNDRLRVVVHCFFAVLGRRVAADVEGLAANGNLFAIGLVDGPVNLLEVIRVGDDLVVGDDVLCEEMAISMAPYGDLRLAKSRRPKVTSVAYFVDNHYGGRRVVERWSGEAVKLWSCKARVVSRYLNVDVFGRWYQTDIKF
jgi:hypothetical protein